MISRDDLPATGMTIDHSERADMIAATIENYKIGEFGVVRTKSILVLCGLNATEISDLMAPHRASAYQNYKNYQRAPVK